MTGVQRAFALADRGAVGSIEELIACAGKLAGRRAELTPGERALARAVPAAARGVVEGFRERIAAAADPLGDAYCQLRRVTERRRTGAVYTPLAIVRSMVNWAACAGSPVRVVDPGTGSGRFLMAAAARFPDAELFAVETDPVAVLLLRANAAVLGFDRRLRVSLTDYRDYELPASSGRTLFIGNPPYVRHHDLPGAAKAWFAQTAARYGLKASKLAGAHVHFMLKTRELVRPGDYGVFITSAEWLHVNYGGLVRNILANGLGGVAIHILAPDLRPFADATTTGAITCFRVGARTTHLCLRRVTRMSELDLLSEGADRAVPWSTLERVQKWSVMVRRPSRPRSGFVELGELFSVHRGQVTGANAVWIAGRYPGELPAGVLVPAVTKAKELLGAGEVLRSARRLRCVIELPEDLDLLPSEARVLVQRFLAWARRQGAHQSYIARHRRPWWRVALRNPAPILSTYMARRPPAFVRNLCGARHLNIAHGLYPRAPLGEDVLLSVVRYLNRNVQLEAGRTYAGGLTKFEPGELERLHVPSLQMLHATVETVALGRAEAGCRNRPRRVWPPAA